MQKRVVYNFNAQTATESAAKNSTGKAVKASNAISKIKRAFSGKSIKLAVLVVLLFVSLFCTIGSADWIISQQKNVPNSQDGSANATFKFDDLGLNNHIEIPNVAFSGNPAQANFLKTAPNSGRDLPDEVEQSIKQSIKYKVKPYNQTSAQSRVFRAPKNAAASTAKNMAPAAYANETLPDENFFADSEWTNKLPTDAGTYAVLIISKVGEISYGKAIKVFTIAPCPVRIVWSGNQKFTYDGTAHPITATAYKADEIAKQLENILSISLTYKAPGAADSTAATTVSEVKNAGTYTAAVTITNKNYAISSNETYAATATTTFTVEKKALTVTANDETVTYGENAPAYTFSCDGLASTDSPASLGTPNFSCAYSTTSTVEGSPYEIKVSGLENLNYNINYVSGKLTVNKRELTLNWGTTSFVYDGEAQTPNPTANNAVTGDNLGLNITITGENITGSPASAINVGTYTATAAITNNNYVIATGNQTAKFTITARALTVTADNKTVTYGESEPAYTFSCNGLVSTDSAESLGTPTFSCAYTSTSAVGTYTITVSGLTNSNYKITYYNGTLTVTPGTITITVIGKTISYGDPAPTSYELTCDNADINANISVLGTPEFTCDYTIKSPVGTYTITVSGLALANYTITCNPANLIVKKREVTISGWNKTSFTYNGAEQKPEPSFDNVVTGDDLKAKVEVNKQSINKGKYTATVTIFNSNYTLTGSNSTTFTINPLDIKFKGIIECNYTSGGITFNAGLFSGKFEAVDTSSSVSLSTVHNDIIDGTAQNFDSDNGVALPPETGLFSYDFGETTKITAGSTYLISDVQLDSNSNFNLTTNSVYLKYKTAKIKIGDDTTFYTIEDALAKSGTITLCGDATKEDSYVITAFSKLSLSPLTGNDFKDYKSDYEYTLESGRTLLLPYNSDNLAINSDDDIKGCSSAKEYVYSALVISQGMNFNIKGTLDIGGRLYTNNGNKGQAITKEHSVVFNNGTLTVTNRINSYGYLKGTSSGLIDLQSTATALDIMRIYDWLGGTEAIQIHNANIFPFKAYSIHNISCKTKITKGAQYLAKVSINVQDTLFPNDPITVVGSSGSMFTIDNGYIYKSASNADSNQSSTELASITGTNQLKGQKDIIILGDNAVCHDNSITLTIEMDAKLFKVKKEITTKTDYPLPISYINIVVPNNATLNLTAVSYTFYPGSSLKVETGGNLNIENVSVVFYTLNDCIADESWSKNRAKYATTEGKDDYAVDRTDAKLTIAAGGKATISSNASISGHITAANAQAELIINSNASATIKVPTDLKSNSEASTTDKFAIASGRTKASVTNKTYNSIGKVITGINSYEEQNLTVNTYYSVDIATNATSVYAWFKNSATITYNPNGGALNGTSGNTTQNVTLPSGGFTNLPGPTRNYYKFDGWYYDNGTFSQEATAIFTDCTLYAKWTAIVYTIKYTLPYDECGTLADGSLSGTEVKTLTTPPQTITVDGTEYTFGGWYLNPEYMGDPITEVSAANATGTIINVYAFYRGGTYTVNYNENPNPDNITFANNINVNKPESQVFYKGQAVSQLELHSLNSYNNNTSLNYYFAGWYLSTDSNKTIISSLPNTIDGDITLCALWVKKALLKIELPVFENGIKTENTTIYNTNKYFYNQKLTVGIDNLSEYIASVYTVPGTYKFIGFNASAGFTATQNYENLNAITTNINVGATSNEVTITADIRKILKVDITMTASAKYSRGWLGEDSKDFEINQIVISSNSMYSTNLSSGWLISNGSDVKQKTTGTQTFYVLEDSNGVNIEIYIKDISIKVAAKNKTFLASNITFTQTGGCTKNTTSSPFTFTIKDDSTMSWTEQQTAT